MASGNSAAASTLGVPGGSGTSNSGTGGSTTQSQISVALTGANAVSIGTPVQYSASIAGSANTAVTWAISGASGVNYGTVSASGLYTPPVSVPAVNGFKLIATSVADPTKSASQAVTLSNPVAAITSVTLTPGYHSSFLVDIYGTGFLPISQAQYLGYGAATTYVSSTHLQFTTAARPPLERTKRSR